MLLRLVARLVRSLRQLRRTRVQHSPALVLGALVRRRLDALGELAEGLDQSRMLELGRLEAEIERLEMPLRAAAISVSGPLGKRLATLLTRRHDLLADPGGELLIAVRCWPVMNAGGSRTLEQAAQHAQRLLADATDALSARREVVEAERAIRSAELAFATELPQLWQRLMIDEGGLSSVLANVDSLDSVRAIGVAIKHATGLLEAQQAQLRKLAIDVEKALKLAGGSDQARVAGPTALEQRVATLYELLRNVAAETVLTHSEAISASAKTHLRRLNASAKQAVELEFAADIGAPLPAGLSLWADLHASPVPAIPSSSIGHSLEGAGGARES
jgi:hypothetical protein